jgi:hypothetical protein
LHVIGRSPPKRPAESFTYESSVAILSEAYRLLEEIVNQNFQQLRRNVLILKKNSDRYP